MMETEQRNADRYASYLEKRYFKYEEHSCTVIDVTLNELKGLARPNVVRSSKSNLELRDWVSRQPSNQDGIDRVRLILAPRISDDPAIALLRIPFSKDTFDVVMKEFRLPKTLLHTIGTQYTSFSGILHSREVSNVDWNGCVMRMGAIAGHRDLAAAMSWSTTNGSTYILLLGCEPSDVKAIETFLTYSGASIRHPLLFLALLADLQIKRYEDLHRRSDQTLTLALFNAGLARTAGEEVLIAPTPTAMQGLVIDYDNLNRDVLYSYKTAGNLCQSLLRFRAQIGRIAKAVQALEMPTGKKALLEVDRKRLHDYLGLTSEAIDDLVEKSRLTTNTSSLLMSAIFNLIAQKENKINQSLAKESKEIAEQSAKIASESKNLAESSQRLAAESKRIAEDSREIAKATKRDSTSMKAIAMLTMVFLPATFVSTLLSMPMFDWDRKPGENLLAYRNFRVYLATALPMTAVVMMVWSTWMCWPRKGLPSSSPIAAKKKKRRLFHMT